MDSLPPFHPIGFVVSDAKYRCDAPRQAVFAKKPARIAFLPDARFSLAAVDLEGFDRIWVLFCFHLNAGQEWKAKVRPPVSPENKRYGVFATRSPHRPNPIGLSCVELLAVEKDGLRIGPCDLLDGTPVLDIKPYLPEVDAFPDSAAGWRDRIVPAPWHVVFDDGFLRKAEWILAHSSLDVSEFCRIQLSRNPLDKRRKRVVPLDTVAGRYAIGYRTWRIFFRLDSSVHSLTVQDIVSHYTAEDLRPETNDPYADKALHRDFHAFFGSSSFSEE